MNRLIDRLGVIIHGNGFEFLYARFHHTTLFASTACFGAALVTEMNLDAGNPVAEVAEVMFKHLSHMRSEAFLAVNVVVRAQFDMHIDSLEAWGVGRERRRPNAAPKMALRSGILATTQSSASVVEDHLRNESAHDGGEQIIAAIIANPVRESGALITVSGRLTVGPAVVFIIAIVARIIAISRPCLTPTLR